MPCIIAILFEERTEESYIAIRLDGAEPEIVFTKGPAFTKVMGPFPEQYAEATFRKWHYRKVQNPPAVNPRSRQSLAGTLACIRPQGNDAAVYVPQER